MSRKFDPSTSSSEFPINTRTDDAKPSIRPESVLAGLEPQLLLRRLEPRVLFDAAALVTVLDIADSGEAGAQIIGHDAPDAPQADGGGNAPHVLLANPDAREVVFVDAGIRDADVIATAFGTRAEVVQLTGGQDGLAQIADYLGSRAETMAVHIVSHGGPGELWLGGEIYDTQALESEAATLASIGAALGSDGDILLYGCDVSAGESGAAFMAALANLTGADIAASSDSTGAAERGGDWDLETRSGEIDVAVLSVPEWNGILAPLTISTTAPPDIAYPTTVPVGGSVVWTNAGFVGATAIDIKATVISADPSVSTAFMTAGDDPTVAVFTNATGGGSTTIRWEIFQSGTGQTVAATGTPNFTIQDIDGTGAPFTIETVAPNQDGLLSFTVDQTSALNVTTPNGQIIASGTNDDSVVAGGPTRPSAAITFSWSDVSSWEVTYTAERANDGRLFQHDGDGDFSFTNPVTTSLPKLDLDGDNSTAAFTAYEGTFTEDGPPVPIADGDVSITNVATLHSATIVLTNAQADDVLALNSTLLGTLGLTGTVDTSVGGQITVTLTATTGLAPAANFEQAIANAVTFENTSDNPAVVDRNLTVSISNGTLSGNVATSTIHIVPLNDAPVAQDDVEATDENTILNQSVLTNNGNGPDSDPDGNTLTVTQVNGAAVVSGAPINLPSGAILTMNGNGSYAYDPNGQFNALAVGETATEAFTYQISDGNGETDTATVTLTILGANDAPVPVDPANPTVPPADPDAYMPSQNGTDALAQPAFDLTPYFGDPDASDTLTTTVSGLPAGLDYNPATNSIEGTPSSSASQGGPNADGIYPVSVTVADGNGGSFTTTIVYTIVNPAPDARDDAVATNEDNSTGGSVLSDNGFGADTDPDGDALTVSQVAGNPANVAVPTAGGNGGLFKINPDGTFTFAPNGEFDDLAVGETRTTTLDYQVSDGNGGTDTATVTVTVTGVNDTPVPIDPANPTVSPADPNAYLPAQAGTDAALQPAFNLTPYFGDPDATDTLTTTVSGLPAGLVYNPATNSIEGTPDSSASQGGPNADGIYPVTVTVDDGNGGTFSTTVVYMITNPAPIAEDDSFSVSEDNPLGGDIFADNGGGIDRDPDGDPIFVSEVGGNPAGVGVASAGSAGGLFTINANGTLSFSPNGEFEDLAVGETRDTTITYQISDGQGGTDSATVTVTVTGMNDAPIPVDPANPATPPADPNAYIPGQAGADGAVQPALVLTPYFSDPDATDTLDVTVSGLPAGLAYNPATNSIEGTPVSNASQGGPNADGNYPVLITVDDGNGGMFTTTVVYSIVNPAPVAEDDGLVASEDGAISGSVFADNGSGADQDPDGDVITVSQVDGKPASVGVPVAGSSGGLFTIQPDGSMDFDPNGQFEDLAVGETRDTSITYEISDGQGGTDTATVTIAVTGVNDAPVPVDPGNPTVPPADPNAYIPQQSGTDAEAQPALDLTPFFGDPDGTDTLTTSVAGLPAGMVYNPATNSIEGNPASDASQGGPNADGIYPVTVTVDDGNGGSFTTTIIYAIVNPAPIAQDDQVVTTEDNPVTGSVLADNGSGPDVDPDGDTILVSQVAGSLAGVGAPSAGSQGGLFTINPDGSFTFDPDGAFDDLAVGESRDTMITYEISDAQGGLDTATVTITVAGLNDAPVVIDPANPANPAPDPAAVIPAQSGTDSQPIVPVMANLVFADPDTSDTLTFSATGLPSGLSIDPASGEISGTLSSDASVSGPYSAVVTATDDHGASTSVTFVWHVANPAPVAVDDAIRVEEEKGASGSVLGNDRDPDGDVLQVSQVNGQPTGVGTPVAGSTGGTFVINADGSYEFEPGDAFAGLIGGQTAVTSVTYQISDGQGGFALATLTITVEGKSEGLNLSQVDTGGSFGFGRGGASSDGGAMGRGQEWIQGDRNDPGEQGAATIYVRHAANDATSEIDGQYVNEYVRHAVEGNDDAIERQYGAGAPDEPLRHMLGLPREDGNSAMAGLQPDDLTFWDRLSALSMGAEDRSMTTALVDPGESGLTESTAGFALVGLGGERESGSAFGQAKSFSEEVKAANRRFDVAALRWLKDVRTGT